MQNLYCHYEYHLFRITLKKEWIKISSDIISSANIFYIYIITIFFFPQFSLHYLATPHGWSPTALLFRLRFPNQIPPPTLPWFQGRSQIKAPMPIPMPIPTTKAVMPTHTVIETMGTWVGTGDATVDTWDGFRMGRGGGDPRVVFDKRSQTRRKICALAFWN